MINILMHVVEHIFRWFTSTKCITNILGWVVVTRHQIERLVDVVKCDYDKVQ